MIELAIMIEGQDGLNWPRWQRLAKAAENLGFAGLFRSDHFTNASGPHKDALKPHAADRIWPPRLSRLLPASRDYGLDGRGGG